MNERVEFLSVKMGLAKTFLCKNIPMAVLVILFVVVIQGYAETDRDLPFMNAIELIRHWGYEPENHTVTTEDGYILELHRIGHGKGRPFIIQHGLHGASDLYLLRGPKTDFAFLLADAGYDVWFPNNRGSVYGRRHIRYTAKDEEFWDFTWDEMGYYDMPASIDYILNVTGHSNVMFMGHSLGATLSYVLLSTRPEYNKKLALAFGLGPVAFCSQVPLRDWIRPLAKKAHDIRMQLRKKGIYDLFDRDAWRSKFLVDFCDKKKFQAICLFNLFIIMGFDKEQVVPEIVPRFLSHYPAGSSAKILEHAAQTFLTDDFRKFDYGKEKNLEVYGSETPPAYNLSLITAPMALYYSSNDHLSSVKDVARLASKLPNLIGNFQVSNRKFNHFDFVWARDVKKLVYDHMFTIMKKYESVE